MAFPFRGSWFLFSFSNFFSIDAFGILLRIKSILLRELNSLSISPCITLSLDNKSFALANSSFALLITSSVFSFTSVFSSNAWTRATANSNLLVSALINCFSSCLLSLLKDSVEEITSLDPVFSEVASDTLRLEVLTLSSLSVFLSYSFGWWFEDTEAALLSLLWIASAWTVPPPINIIKAAIATEAAPKLTLRIEKRNCFSRSCLPL